ncbi:RNA-binding component of cleavage and polyadenylation factor [Ascosphaera aggregata]|nr:RNA-binding component of cleavage and polyadenylation factor [Ascosphaera aggregata]
MSRPASNSVTNRNRDITSNRTKFRARNSSLCKKGIKCEYLHEYNLRRMPECQSFARSNYCANGDECLYQHIPFDAKIPPCEHYKRGFCPLGPHCAKKHIREIICPFYLAGFCPDGPKCGKAHPRFPPDEKMEKPRMKSEKTEEEREAELARIREEQEREKEREREWRSQNRRGGGFVKRYGPRKF